MLLSSLTLEELERFVYIENNIPMAKALAQLIDLQEEYDREPNERREAYRYGYERGYHYGRSDGEAKHCKRCRQNTTT